MTDTMAAVYGLTTVLIKAINYTKNKLSTQEALSYISQNVIVSTSIQSLANTLYSSLLPLL